MAKAQSILRIAFGVFAAGKVANLLSPGLLPEPLASMMTWLLLASMIAQSLVGGMSASGAFEVVEKGTGKVYFSKLATGQLPRLADVLESPNAPAAIKGTSVPDKSN